MNVSFETESRMDDLDYCDGFLNDYGVFRKHYGDRFDALRVFDNRFGFKYGWLMARSRYISPYRDLAFFLTGALLTLTSLGVLKWLQNLLTG